MTFSHFYRFMDKCTHTNCYELCLFYSIISPNKSFIYIITLSGYNVNIVNIVCNTGTVVSQITSYYKVAGLSIRYGCQTEIDRQSIGTLGNINLNKLVIERDQISRSRKFESRSRRLDATYVLRGWFICWDLLYLKVPKINY